jgi:hypothetical protein
MKKMAMLILLTSLFICGSIANASDQMVIVFEDGTSQTVNLIKPSFSIRSINLQGGLTTSAKSDNLIMVTAGTYGKNCGASYGNATEHLANACNNKSQCEYTIDYTVIGDPASGCRKDYTAEWRCAHGATVHNASASPEAGFQKKITLSCPR